MACEFAKHGQHVVVNYYPGLEIDAQTTLEEVQELGGDGIIIPADTTNKEQVLYTQ